MAERREGGQTEALKAHVCHNKFLKTLQNSLDGAQTRSRTIHQEAEATTIDPTHTFPLWVNVKKVCKEECFFLGHVANKSTTVILLAYKS